MFFRICMSWKCNVSPCTKCHVRNEHLVDEFHRFYIGSSIVSETRDVITQAGKKPHNIEVYIITFPRANTNINRALLCHVPTNSAQTSLNLLTSP